MANTVKFSFINNLDDGIECTINKLEVDTKLGKQAGTPEEPPPIQGDSDRLELHEV